jgi:acyl-CoA synthetase (AMP-forming)/AMP-acid ligase II
MQDKLLKFDFRHLIFRERRYTQQEFTADIENTSAEITLLRQAQCSPFIFLLSDNSYKAAVYYYAILKAGLIPVLADPDTTDMELNELIELVPPFAIIHPDNKTDATKLSAEIFITNSQFDTNTAAQLRGVRVVMFTNAENGRMKAAMITEANILSGLECCFYADKFTDDPVLCGLVPFYHIYGLITGLMLGTICKGDFIIREMSTLLDVGGMIDSFTENRLSNLYTVPLALYLIGKSAKASALAGRLHSTVSGGYKLSAEIAKAFESRTGSAVREGYGITEATGIASTHNPGIELRIDSVGIPVPQVEVKVTGPMGSELETGLVGEICLSGNTIIAGYYNDKAATGEFFPEGTLRTGDFGFIDADGYIYLTGLKKRMLNVAGKNVYPAELERMFMLSGLVKKCYIYGEYTGIFGHRVVAKLELASTEADAEEKLKTWAKNNISAFKMPKRWEFAAEEVLANDEAEVAAQRRTPQIPAPARQ